MKQHKISKSQKAVIAPRATSASGVGQNENNFLPSSKGVARKAYFANEIQGSMPNHEAQHCLMIEAELIARRNLNRVHVAHSQP